MSENENTTQAADEERPMSDKFPQHHKNLLDALAGAVMHNSLALMRCKNKAGEDRSVVCLVQPDPQEEGGMTFVPLAELIESEDIYGQYDPPSEASIDAENASEATAVEQAVPESAESVKH